MILDCKYCNKQPMVDVISCNDHQGAFYTDKCYRIHCCLIATPYETQDEAVSQWNQMQRYVSTNSSCEV